MSDKINIKQWEDLITDKTGLIISKQNRDDFKAILLKRMLKKGFSTEADYLKLVLESPEELHKLASVLTVKETYFFREPAHLQLLTGKLLPAMLKEKNDNEKINILCAGCATGAEPYSIAIMIAEDIGVHFLNRFSIWGIDIDASAVDHARQGIYGRHSFRDCDPALKDRYFMPVAQERFRIIDSLKNQVTFLQHNLAADVFPADLNNIDVIFYRNVSIYFNEARQKKIFTRLAGLLQPNGYLFMSATEILAHDSGILSLCEQDGVYYFSGKDNVSSVSPRHLLSMPHLSSPEQKKRPHEQKKTSYPVAHTLASMQADQKASNKSTAALGTKTNSITPPEKVVDVNELFSQAISMVEAKSYDDAVKIADKIIMLKPADVRYQTFKAGILMNLNQFQEAESLCLKATTADPLWLEGHYLAGIIAMQAKRPDDALDRFRKSVYLEPCCWQAHFYLGELQRQRGEKERAIQAFNRAVVCLGLPAANDKDSLFMRINYPVEQVMRMCQYQIQNLAGKG